MNYHKRIVLDFDDTLSFSQNRDWINAVPNLKLIEKTNKLYEAGWIIDIYTARGSISCNDRQSADKLYRPSIEEWLLKHKVKYHSISFDKPLAAYYIDDKGITPEDFINVDIKQLEGGLSGADVYSDGKLVHKKDPSAHLVRNWYETVKGIKTPKIDRIVGDTISMEYIEHDKSFFQQNPHIGLGLILQALDALKENKYNHKYGPTIMDYRFKIGQHIDRAPEQMGLFNKIYEQLLNIVLPPSFHHGDFGITNMLFTKDKELYLIDPITNGFGCTELDSAKFIASLWINEYENKFIHPITQMMCLYNKMEHDTFKILVASEIIRVYKYHPNKNFIVECINNVLR